MAQAEMGRRGRLAQIDMERSKQRRSNLLGKPPRPLAISDPHADQVTTN